MSNHSPSYIPANLKAVRIQSELSQTEMAFLFAFSSSYLGNIETGTQALQAGRIVNVTQCFGISLDDLSLLPAQFEERRLAHCVETVKGRIAQHRRLMAQTVDEMNLVFDKPVLPDLDPIMPEVTVDQPACEPDRHQPVTSGDVLMFGFLEYDRSTLFLEKGGREFELSRKDAEAISLLFGFDSESKV